MTYYIWFDFMQTLIKKKTAIRFGFEEMIKRLFTVQPSCHQVKVIRHTIRLET